MTSCASFSLLPQVSFSMRSLSRLLLQASDENKTQRPSPSSPSLPCSLLQRYLTSTNRFWSSISNWISTAIDILLQEQAYRILTRIPTEKTVTMKLATICLSIIAFSGRAYVFLRLSIAIIYWVLTVMIVWIVGNGMLWERRPPHDACFFYCQRTRCRRRDSQHDAWSRQAGFYTDG